MTRKWKTVVDPRVRQGHAPSLYPHQVEALRYTLECLNFKPTPEDHVGSTKMTDTVLELAAAQMDQQLIQKLKQKESLVKDLMAPEWPKEWTSEKPDPRAAGERIVESTRRLCKRIGLPAHQADMLAQNAEAIVREEVKRAYDEAYADVEPSGLYRDFGWDEALRGHWQPHEGAPGEKYMLLVVAREHSCDISRHVDIDLRVEVMYGRPERKYQEARITQVAQYVCAVRIPHTEFERSRRSMREYLASYLNTMLRTSFAKKLEEERRNVPERYREREARADAKLVQEARILLEWECKGWRGHLGFMEDVVELPDDGVRFDTDQQRREAYAVRKERSMAALYGMGERRYMMNQMLGDRRMGKSHAQQLAQRELETQTHGVIVNTFHVRPGEEIFPGDLVSLDSNGHVVKTKPGAQAVGILREITVNTSTMPSKKGPVIVDTETHAVVATKPGGFSMGCYAPEPAASFPGIYECDTCHTWKGIYECDTCHTWKGTSEYDHSKRQCAECAAKCYACNGSGMERAYAGHGNIDEDECSVCKPQSKALDNRIAPTWDLLRQVFGKLRGAMISQAWRDAQRDDLGAHRILQAATTAERDWVAEQHAEGLRQLQQAARDRERRNRLSCQGDHPLDEERDL